MDHLPTIEIEDLLTWAIKKPPQRPIGKVASVTACPLACYLNEQEEPGAQYWRVGGQRIETPDGGRFITPDHLHSVIFHVDNCSDCEDGYIYPPAFIYILQTVQQRMKEGAV